MLRLIFPILILSMTVSSYAQELSLDTALHEVLGDSPHLQATKSMVEEANWKRREVFGSGFMPKLRANGSYLTNKKYQFINIGFNGVPVVIPTIIPNSQFNLLAELPLFNGFVSFNRYSAADKKAEAARATFEWEKFKTEMSVKLAFYQALASKIIRDVAIQNVKVLTDHKNQAVLFKKGGLSTNYDVLRVEVQESNAKTDLADAEDAIVIAKEKLIELLGHENDNRELVGELPIPEESIIQETSDTLAGRSDLKALRLETLARADEEKAEGRYWVPEFSLFGQYTFYNNLSNGLNDYGSYRNSRQVGFMMTWNLFDGLVSHSRAHQAIQRKVQTEKQLRMGNLAANRDIHTWNRRYLSQCRIYQARVEDVKRSEESVRLAKEGRRVGSRTDTELLDAELDLYRSRAGTVRAQLAAVEALINLQLAQGKRYKE